MTDSNAADRPARQAPDAVRDVRARLKPLAVRPEGSVARVCCGRPSCPAELGRLYERHDFWPGDAAGRPPDCLVGNAAGFRRHGDAFRVERRPRRGPSGASGARGGCRHVYPWLPELPVTIICPVCGARNRVERPEARPPSVAERSDIWYTVECKSRAAGALTDTPEQTEQATAATSAGSRPRADRAGGRDGMAARHHHRQSRATRQGRRGKGAHTSMAPTARPPITVAYELDPADMALRGRLGAYVLHSRRDPRETTRKARQAFEERFLREVDPDGVLPEAERRRRAAAARRAYFARIALKSVRARRAAKRRRLVGGESRDRGGAGTTRAGGADALRARGRAPRRRPARRR